MEKTHLSIDQKLKKKCKGKVSCGQIKGQSFFSLEARLGETEANYEVRQYGTSPLDNQQALTRVDSYPVGNKFVELEVFVQLPSPWSSAALKHQNKR